jgi:hypothetical protein
VVAGLLSVAACTAEYRDPVGIGPPINNGGTSGGGTSSGGSAQEALVGSWENTIALSMSGDLQTVTTRWDFAASGSCRKSVRTFSTLDGMITLSSEACTWSFQNQSVVIQFTDTMSVSSFSLDFPGFQRDVILLGGIEFRRTL